MLMRKDLVFWPALAMTSVGMLISDLPFFLIGVYGLIVASVMPD